MRLSRIVPSLVVVFVPLLSGLASAQVPTGPANPHNTYGSPLDTLMSSRLWTNVGPGQDFVQETRPDAKTLSYQPLTGTDPERPKPRDKANVSALQAELEHDGAQNARKGGALGGSATHPAGKRHRKSATSQ